MWSGVAQSCVVWSSLCDADRIVMAACISHGTCVGEDVFLVYDKGHLVCVLKVVLGSVLSSFVVQSSTRDCFVQALQYKVGLEIPLCKSCSTK